MALLHGKKMAKLNTKHITRLDSYYYIQYISVRKYGVMTAVKLQKKLMTQTIFC
jgi:hypothetical protein